MPAKLARWQRLLRHLLPIQSQHLGYADAHIGRAIDALHGCRKMTRDGDIRGAQRAAKVALDAAFKLSYQVEQATLCLPDPGDDSARGQAGRPQVPFEERVPAVSPAVVGNAGAPAHNLADVSRTGSRTIEGSRP